MINFLIVKIIKKIWILSAKIIFYIPLLLDAYDPDVIFELDLK